MRESLFPFLLLIFLLGGCIPTQEYKQTHYQINLRIDPEENKFLADIQMVFIPERDYSDSITLLLHKKSEIISLSAQELIRYHFSGQNEDGSVASDAGKLVLAIEEAVHRGERIHISLSYTGELCPVEDHPAELTLNKFWYPQPEEEHTSSYDLTISSPGNFTVGCPGTLSQNKTGWRIYQSDPSKDIPVSILKTKAFVPSGLTGRRKRF